MGVTCPNKDCRDFGKQRKKNIRLHELYGRGRWKRYKCKTCKRTFSERRGTPLFRLHIEEGQAVQILTLQARGASIRTTAEAVGVATNTVMSVTTKAGHQAKAIHDHLVRNLKLGQLQVDEIYTFIQKKGHPPSPKRQA